MTTNQDNSNIISNSKKIKNVNQIQNESPKQEMNTNLFYFNQLITSIHELTKEVKELKEQIKNKES